MSDANLNESFGTLSETVNGLMKLGYTLDFNIQQECLVCQRTNLTLSPEDFQIEKVYRFEGASNPDDEAIVYAISSPVFGVKGILVNGYGISADDISSGLVEKLQTHNADIITGQKSDDSASRQQKVNSAIDAPLAEINIKVFISQMKQAKTWAGSPHSATTLYKSDNMRIVLMGLHEGAEIKPHKANGVISVQVIEGKINFITEQQTALIEEGQMIALHENIMHRVEALSESFFLLTLAMNK